MNERIKELIRQAGGIDEDDDGYELTPILVGTCLVKFADLIIEDAESEAIKLIKFIASDYVELSDDKVLWQRNDYIKRCHKFLDEYRGTEEL